jgi:hypothetical protein
MKNKVAIVNRTNLKNFGSVLQVYALCDAVKKLGYDSEVVWQSGNISQNYDLRPNKAIKIVLKLLLHPTLLWSTIKTIREVKANVIDEGKIKKFNNFVAKNFKQTFYAPDEIEKVAASDKYFKFICGSDQIWCTTTLYPDPMMYLRFTPKEKRVAYAPSLGRNYIPNYNRRILKKYISDVPCVSVREDEGHCLIKELTGRDATVVADPTLLMRSNEWDRLKAEVDLPDKYVLCYFLDDPSADVKTAICKFAKGSDLNIVVLGKLGAIDYPTDRIYKPTAGPGEFLTISSKAQMIITDSYHGMLFAINYHKKFWSVERSYSQFDQSSRQLTILSRLGIKNRYVKKNFNFTDAEIDYNAVQTKIDVFVAYSMNFLKNSLEK